MIKKVIRTDDEFIIVTTPENLAVIPWEGEFVIDDLVQEPGTVVYYPTSVAEEDP